MSLILGGGTGVGGGGGLTQSQVDARIALLASGLTEDEVDDRITLLAGREIIDAESGLPDLTTQAAIDKHYLKTVAIRHDTLYITEKVDNESTDAGGTWSSFTHDDYLGVRTSDASSVPSNDGKFYYSFSQHAFRQYNSATNRWLNVTLSEAINNTNARWLGDFPDRQHATNYITSFNSSLVYHAIFSNGIKVLDNSTYTAPVIASTEYHWVNPFARYAPGIYQGVWVIDFSYQEGHISRVGNIFYVSLVNDNIGNSPTTDDGSNWFDLSSSDATAIEVRDLLQTLTGADRLNVTAVLNAVAQSVVDQLFNSASIDSGVLTLSRLGSGTTPIMLTLPTGDGMTDGVVTSATIDPTTFIVTITTSTSDTVALNLSPVLSTFLTQADVDARAAIRFTDAEKAKVAKIPATIADGDYLRGNADGDLETVQGTPVDTERVILYEDTSSRTESNGTFFEVALSRAPAEGRLLDIEIFFDGTQPGSNANDEPQDRWNTVIPMLLESDDFLSRPVHSSSSDPTGSIPFKTTRDIQLINGGAGFSHTTIYIAKGNAAGTTLRVGSAHLSTFGSFVLRVVEYIQNAPVTDGTETNLEEGTRTTTTVEVVSSTGDNATLQEATDDYAGVMTSAQKMKVDRLGSVQRSDVNSQAQLNALTTEDWVALAKIVTAFGTYQVNTILIYDSEADAWEVLVDASEYGTAQDTQYHRTYEREYVSGITRNNSNQITINQHSGDEYNVDISRHTGAQALPESYLNNLPVDTEVSIVDGDVVWEGYLVSVHDDDETTATLRIAFGEREGTFTDGETVEISFGYSPAARQNAEETPVDATGFDGNLADTDDTVQKVAQKLDDLTLIDSDSATSRGNLITTSNALPTTGITNAAITGVAWTTESNAPTGFAPITGATTSFGIPRVRPSNPIIGIWAVAEVDDVEVAEVFIPWGGGGATTDDATGQYSIFSFGFSDSILAEIQYHIAAAATPRLTLYGKNANFVANSIVKLYFAIATPGGQGEDGEQGEPGDSHVPVPTTADEGETLAVNADGDFEVTAFAGLTRIANITVDDLNGDINIGQLRDLPLNRDLEGLAGFDLQFELISTATNVNVRTFSPTVPIEQWLALPALDLLQAADRNNPVRNTIQLHVQRINNVVTGSFGWADLGIIFGRVSGSVMAFAISSVTITITTINVYLIPRTGVNE